MSWSTTGAVGEFLAEAGDFLYAEPVRKRLYERLGYHAVEDRTQLSFAPPPGRGR